MSYTTSPHPDAIATVMSKLTSTDEKVVNLAKEIASFAYNEERKKTSSLEERAFGLMQFAKVGLTVIAGIAGLISNASIHDTPFRESLIFLLAVASTFLAKLFWRSSQVVRVGTIFKPHTDDHFKPDQKDVYETQSGEYLEVLKSHVAKIVLCFEHTAGDNLKRIYQCKCCFINTFGFLVAFFLFFALSMVHLIEPNITLALPFHRVIGGALFLLALATDWLVELSCNRWLKENHHYSNSSAM
jgi:hypothetical protein